MNEHLHIRTTEDLRRHKARLKAVLHRQEKELQGRIQELPGEVFSAGINAVLPAFLSGKITTSALQLGKRFINHALRPGHNGRENARLFTAAKQVGLFSALRLAYRILARKFG